MPKEVSKVVKRRSKRAKPVRQDPRDQVVTILLSNSEREMLDRFVAKYRLSSRSAYIRHLVMTDVLSKLFDDMPTLFDQQESKTRPEESQK